MCYADEHHAVVVGGVVVLELYLSLLLRVGSLLGEFRHAALEVEAHFACVAFPAYGVSGSQLEFVAVVVGHFEHERLAEAVVCEACHG